MVVHNIYLILFILLLVELAVHGDEAHMHRPKQETRSAVEISFCSCTVTF